MVRWFACALTVSMAVATVAGAQSNVAAPQPTAAPAEKVRCKRYTETGSIAKVRKECHTQAEWQQLAVQGRTDAQNMVRQSIGAGSTPH